MKSSASRLCFLAAGSLLAFSLNSQATILVTGGGSGGPDCGRAAASEAVIWPANGAMVPETITGVTDPYGRPLTIKITGIQQNEPLGFNGSGNTELDGSGVGGAIAYVRAQRAGGGTGRLYFISFKATVLSSTGCTGMVEVYVPHDKGQGFVPAAAGKHADTVGTGKLYNSTQVGG